MRGRPRGCTGKERQLRRSPRGPRACRDDPRTAIRARVNRDRQGNRYGLLSPSCPCRWPAKCRRFVHRREFWTCSTRRARIGIELCSAILPGAQVGVLSSCRFVGLSILELGGSTSHLASLARERGIPMVLGVLDATGRIPDGAQVAVDGVAGVVRWMA